MSKTLKSFEEFKKFTKSDIKIKSTCYTKEEFLKIMKPIMCDICHRIFNPTEEDKKRTKEALNIFDNDFTWELIINRN